MTCRTQTDASLEALQRAVQAAGQPDLLSSFRKEYILRCIARFSNNHESARSALVRVFKAYEVKAGYERRMSHSFFVETLLATKGMVSGRDRSGRPILWVQYPMGLYKIAKGSPEFDAFIRAFLWFGEILLLKTYPGPTRALMLLDESSRRPLDFNISIIQEFASVVEMADPSCVTDIILFGSNVLLRTVWTLFAKTGAGFMKQFRFASDKSEVYEIVSDSGDIPEWWFQNGRGKRHSLSRNNLWEWRRCLGRGERSLSVTEIMNPSEPWIDVLEEASEEHGSEPDSMAPVGDESVDLDAHPKSSHLSVIVEADELTADDFEAAPIIENIT